MAIITPGWFFVWAVAGIVFCSLSLHYSGGWGGILTIVLLPLMLVVGMALQGRKGPRAPEIDLKGLVKRTAPGATPGANSAEAKSAAVAPEAGSATVVPTEQPTDEH